MNGHVGPTSPDQSAPPPVASYSREQKPTWNLFGKFFALFSNRTTAIAGILVLVLGVGAAIVAVQRSTETRQHAAAIISPQGPCYPFGDVNVDGKVNDVDAQLVLKYVEGQPIIGTFNKQNADVDRDGKITSADALIIQKYISGLEATFPVCKMPSPTVVTPGGKTPPCYLTASTIAQLGVPPNLKRGFGDVDGDSIITERDAKEIRNFIAGFKTFDPLQIEIADVDDTPNTKSTASDIQTADAERILRYIAGSDPSFPVCGVMIPTQAPLPTPTPVVKDPNVDTDGDGFSDYIERYLGTDPNSACGPASITGPSTVWPADLYTTSGSLGAGVNKINIQDITAFTAPIRRLDTGPGDANFDKRYDLNADGVINNADIDKINNLYPPMFDGLRAVNGPSSCQNTIAPLITPWSVTPIPAN